ncbi:MAG: trimeric intracellular cation channel family protein [Verrucomicrobia bacterium]|jgi:uncharacterized membrane protein YeiH|nr:trimeric intracellular cation channel family protein [Verrucomicrobiota bacterium]
MNTPLVQTVVEHAAISVSAMGGVLAARGKRIDLFGVVVLALATSFGGGTVRDVLVGDLPVVWLRVPDYLINGTVTALVTFGVVRLWSLPKRALLVADAFALALFTVIGTAKGHALGLSAPVCVLLGVITGVAGGIVRDILLGEVPLVFQPQIHLYATAALAGASVFMALKYAGIRGVAVTGAGIGVVLLLRLLGIRWKISLPIFEAGRN